MKVSAEFDEQSQRDHEKTFQNDFEKKYRELKTLGEGCASVVKKCENKGSNEVVATKIIRSDDDEFILISKREFEVMKNLENDNIVKVHECIHDEQKGRLYIVMEYIHGQTIEDFVNDQAQD